MPTTSFPRAAVMTLALASFLVPTGGAARAAEDELKREMSAVAKQVKLLLDQAGKDAIAVGDFRGAARLDSSSGPCIVKSLTESLKGLGVVVKGRSEFEVNGEYRDVEDLTSHRIAVGIKVRVVDRSGAEVSDFQQRGVFNVPLIAALTGATASLPADGSEKARDKALSDALDLPSVHLGNADTRVSARANSPYAIEVLVKSGGDFLPRAVSVDGEGFAFVKVGRDETYALKLINDSPRDAAVALTIDGLNVFAFSKDPDKNYSHWIVPARHTLSVLGWHVGGRSSDPFRVTEYARSAVGDWQAGSATTGTITACFAAAWPVNGLPPEDEPGVIKFDGSNITCRGPSMTKDLVVARMLGRFREAVSVRYNKGFEPGDVRAPSPKP